MMRRVLLWTSSHLTALLNLTFSGRVSGWTYPYTRPRFFSDWAMCSDSPQTRVFELPRIDSLVDGCDYKHWVVVMHPPEKYPHREEIVQQYIATLAMGLGSEKAAMESIYSVSTKYYYAFSCKINEKVTHKIKSLPRVKWVFPDSYLCGEESGYGGEPFVDGNVVPYEDKYHADWLAKEYIGDSMGRTCSRKSTRRRKASRNSRSTSD